MNRYLTDIEKAQLIDVWLVTRQTTFRPDGEDLGGKGYPDPEIYHLTDCLNALPGIATCQSCSGHRHEGKGEGVESMRNGQLWLRLTKERWDYVDTYAYGLLHAPGIERVQRIYHQDWGDVLDIHFAGLNRSDAQLEVSSRSIVNFFGRALEAQKGERDG